MRLYNYDWAHKVVLRFAESDPRVEACISRWVYLFKEDGENNGQEIVISRLIYFLRRRDLGYIWRWLKKLPENKIAWTYAYRKYIKPIPKQTYSIPCELNFDLYDNYQI